MLCHFAVNSRKLGQVRTEVAYIVSSIAKNAGTSKAGMRQLCDYGAWLLPQRIPYCQGRCSLPTTMQGRRHSETGCGSRTRARKLLTLVVMPVRQGDRGRAAAPPLRGAARQQESPHPLRLGAKAGKGLHEHY
jgi:hypothetical protein